MAYVEVPLGPFLDRGRRLDPSSLFAANDVATESWLWLFDASLRSDGGWSRVESTLREGEAVPLGGMAPRETFRFE